MSRSARTLIATVLFVLAAFIIINLVIMGSELGDWLLPVILLGIGLILALYPEAEAVAEPEPVHDTAAAPLPATEPKPALSAGAAATPAEPPPVEAEPEPEPEPVVEETTVEVEEVEVEENPWATGVGTDVPQPVSDVEDVPPTRAPVVEAGGSTAAVETPDDLTVVEGIGKKMSAALIDSGIDTYEKLANTSEEDLRAAIKAAGMRFAPSIPTWSTQASYAAKDDWEGLRNYQSTLTAGRAPE